MVTPHHISVDARCNLQENPEGGGEMARKKTSTSWTSEEVATAFEAGIVFGRMVENRRPRRSPLWSEEEWLQALAKAVGKKERSTIREWTENAGPEEQHREEQHAGEQQRGEQHAGGND